VWAWFEGRSRDMQNAPAARLVGVYWWFARLSNLVSVQSDDIEVDAAP